MSPLPNLPRALLVRRMRAAAPEIYTALVEMIDAYESLVHSEYDGTSLLDDMLEPATRARAALALVEGPAINRTEGVDL